MNRASTVNVRIQQLSKNYYYIFQYVFPRSVHVARYELKSNVHHSHTSWLLVIIQKKRVCERSSWCSFLLPAPPPQPSEKYFLLPPVCLCAQECRSLNYDSGGATINHSSPARIGYKFRALPGHTLLIPSTMSRSVYVTFKSNDAYAALPNVRIFL